MDRPRWRFTANYSLHQRLQVGVELNPKAEEAGPLVTLILLTETETRPALFLDTSSDRIGSPAGEQSYFATISKYIPPVFPRPAPACVVEMLEGGDKALGDLQGKVVLVDFWATWCKPCLETMPRLQKLYSAYSDKGFDVWGCL